MGYSRIKEDIILVSTSTMLGLLISVNYLCAPPCVDAQTIDQSAETLLVTFSEFQTAQYNAPASFRTCINVWQDGRIHIERVLQRSPQSKVDSVAFNSSIPARELSELKGILNTDSIQHLQGPNLPASIAKTWIRGVAAWIARSGSTQKVGYFEWGERKTDPMSGNSYDANGSESNLKDALQPLERWFHTLTPIYPIQPNADVTNCGLSSHD